MGEQICCQCGSTRVTAIGLNSKQAQELGLPTFTILGYQKCLACGATTERFAPMWGWYGGIVIGGALTLFFFAELIFRGTLWIGWLPVAAGFTLAGSITGLVRARKVRIRRRGQIISSLPHP